MRILDIIVIAGIVLALFGPKTLQSLARNAGKTTGGVKKAKDKFMAHEDVSKVNDTLNKVPTNSQQAFHMIVSPDKPEPQAAAVDSQSGESVPRTEPVPKDN
jgi:TatA/E family protein of Tat protein translocase